MSSLTKEFKLTVAVIDVLKLLKHHLAYVNYYMKNTNAPDLKAFIQMEDRELVWTHCQILEYIHNILKYFRRTGCPYNKLETHLKEAEEDQNKG